MVVRDVAIGIGYVEIDGQRDSLSACSADFVVN
jgi:hypothetical protein